MGGLQFKKKRTYFELGGIITGGVLHSEANSIGDKGIPVIPIQKHKEGGYNPQYKLAEIESGEIIIRKNYAREIEDLVNEYNNCKCKNVLLQLGKLAKFIIDNLDDKQCDLNGVCLLVK